MVVELVMEVVVALMITVAVVFANKLQRTHNTTCRKEQPVLLQTVVGDNPELSRGGDVRAALEQ